MTDEAQVLNPMTEEALPPDVTARGDEPTGPGGATPDRSGRQKRPRHPARRSRIAAVGIGVAAMVGLVSNMEVAGSRAQAGGPSASSAGSWRRAEIARRRPAVRPGNHGTAASRRPIVLTPHAVVHTVAAPAAGGSGGSGGSGYVAAAAPAPAAAPAASTGGSR